MTETNGKVPVDPPQTQEEEKKEEIPTTQATEEQTEQKIEEKSISTENPEKPAQKQRKGGPPVAGGRRPMQKKSLAEMFQNIQNQHRQRFGGQQQSQKLVDPDEEVASTGETLNTNIGGMIGKGIAAKKTYD